MTEADWLVGQVRRMVDYVRRHSTMRQRRLLACGYCRIHWAELPDERLKQFVEQIERYADGESGSSLVRAFKLFDTAKSPAVRDALLPGMLAVLRSAQATNEDSRGTAVPYWSDETLQLELLREVFGNPFRPVVTDPGWKTTTVIGLAEGIYSERAFDRMPILADALEDVGCDSVDVLEHCRSDGLHVRGCWVIDALLGRMK